MRLSLPAALLALLAFVPSAEAAGLSGMGLKLFGNYFHFGTKSNISHPMVKGISAGPLKMSLQHTKLAQIKKVFGGTIQTQGSNKTLVNWLCYHTDGGKGGQASNTWFISNILGGGEFVMIVAVEAADAGRMPRDFPEWDSSSSATTSTSAASRTCRTRWSRASRQARCG